MDRFTFCEMPIFILLYVAREFQVVKKIYTLLAVLFLYREKRGEQGNLALLV